MGPNSCKEQWSSLNSNYYLQYVHEFVSFSSFYIIEIFFNSDIALAIKVTYMLPLLGEK